MEKLTAILVIVEDPERSRSVIGKAVYLARGFGARVELLIADFRRASEFAALCSACGYEEVVFSKAF